MTAPALDARADPLLLSELAHGPQTARDLERALFVGLDWVTVGDVEAWCRDAARRGLVEELVDGQWSITPEGAARLAP